ncbi:MAG: PleD family two-component system response regulator [Granulosicoccus sp.]
MPSILLIDDSPTDAHVYGSMLRAEGHEVSIATSGEEGIDSARRLQPDIIIMDVVMPGLNGFEATRLLAREDDTANIPVIILSTRQGESDRLWGLRQGAYDYLCKPVSKPELLSSVDAALEKA